jgi:DNA-binding GntR family transcriptional regulator
MPPWSTRSNSLIELEPGVTRSVPLTDRLYATLKHRLLTCRIAPGERVSEKEICAELHVSRTPVREALSRLALEELVEQTTYRGFNAAPITVDGFRELCEVRRIVEAAGAALAAERGTPEDIAELKQRAHLSYVPGDRDSYEAYLRANSAFHLTLIRCARNSRLERTVMAVIDQLQRPLYLGLQVGIDAQSSSGEHFHIIDAIANHDADRARRFMIDHILAAEVRIISSLQAAGY